MATDYAPSQLVNNVQRVAVSEVAAIWKAVAADYWGYLLAPQRLVRAQSGNFQIHLTEQDVPVSADRAPGAAAGEIITKLFPGPWYECVNRVLKEPIPIESIGNLSDATEVDLVQLVAQNLAQQLIRNDMGQVAKKFSAVDPWTGNYDAAYAATIFVNVGTQVSNVAGAWATPGTATPLADIAAIKQALVGLGPAAPNTLIVSEQVALAIRETDEYKAEYGDRDQQGTAGLEPVIRGMNVLVDKRKMKFGGTDRYPFHDCCVLTRVEPWSLMYTGHAVRPTWENSVGKAAESRAAVGTVSVPELPAELTVLTWDDPEPSKHSVNVSIDAGYDGLVIPFEDGLSPVTGVLYSCLT
jgi:hypothetical protein